jgi:hypothetical protein
MDQGHERMPNYDASSRCYNPRPQSRLGAAAKLRLTKGAMMQVSLFKSSRLEEDVPQANA